MGTILDERRSRQPRRPLRCSLLEAPPNIGCCLSRSPRRNSIFSSGLAIASSMLDDNDARLVTVYADATGCCCRTIGGNVGKIPQLPRCNISVRMPRSTQIWTTRECSQPGRGTAFGYSERHLPETSFSACRASSLDQPSDTPALRYGRGSPRIVNRRSILWYAHFRELPDPKEDRVVL